MLANSHGPVLYCPRPHMPRSSENLAAMDQVSADYLDYPSATVIGPPAAPPFRSLLSDLWPAGIRRALDGLRTAVERGDNPLPAGQYHLGLCRLWQDSTSRLGYPTLVTGDPLPLSPDELQEVRS